VITVRDWVFTKTETTGAQIKFFDLAISQANKFWRSSMTAKLLVALIGPARTGHQFALLLMLCLGGPAFGQPVSKVPHIGWLDFWTQCDSSALEGGLRELGYAPGVSVVIDCRSAQESYDRLPAAASDLVKLNVDVIVAASQPTAKAAYEATQTIPIVMIASGDPVASGLVKSLDHPGGNVTGLTYYATELTAKRLELFHEAVPSLAKVGVLANPVVAYLPFENDTLKAGAAMGLGVAMYHVSEPEDIDRAFEKMSAEGVDGAFILPDLMLAGQAERVGKLALSHRLPTMAWGQWFTKAGCLMSYSAEYPNMTRSLAGFVDKILKGAKPGDLPVDQPYLFRLSVNPTTARALGVTLSPSFAARVDDEID
jgi:putative ABC transport system substrate-binding protein